jgi:hypothetical protein
MPDSPGDKCRISHGLVRPAPGKGSLKASNVSTKASNHIEKESNTSSRKRRKAPEVTGCDPSAWAKCMDQRKISPLGRNDNARSSQAIGAAPRPLGAIPA